MLLVVLAAACGSSTPVGSPVVFPTGAATSAVASPSVMVVADCTIEPDTVCPGAQLTLVSLRGADLHGANMQTTNFRGSDLRDVNFTGAVLIQADFGDADMSRSTLVGADLTQAKLKHANLTGADLTGATLKVSQLSTARLCKTTMPNGTESSTSCASPTPSPSPGGGASPSPSTEVTIDVWQPKVSSVVCPSSPANAEESVAIKYATTNAGSVSFLIDGEDPGMEAGYNANGGTAKLAFVCDKSSHRYTIIATGEEGKVAKQAVTVYRS